MKIRIGEHVHTGRLRFVPSYHAWLIDVGLVLLNPEDLIDFNAAITEAGAVETADLLSNGYLSPQAAEGDTPLIASLKAWVRAQPARAGAATAA